MNYVGKILVIVIMVFALFFLALTTVVFTTSVDWKAENVKLTTAKKGLEDEKRRLTADVQTQKSFVDLAKSELTKAQASFAAQLKSASDENARRGDEITKQRTQVETALQQVKAAQDEAEARISESNVLRDNLQKVQKQRDDFKLQQTELDQKILLLEREVAIAQQNNKDLRERVTLLGSVIREAGLNDSVVTLKRTAPPDVEGVVKRVDARNQTFEISIGSNDGLVEGHEIHIYRTEPTPEYIGKARIVSTDVQTSVAKVIGKTLHGKKILEGDHVATQIRPRG